MSIEIADALQPGAPLIHDEPDCSGFEGVFLPQQNIAAHFAAEAGDVEAGYADAYRVFEGEYRVRQVQHVALEPHVCLTYWDEDDRLVIRSATQVPFHVRRILAPVLSLPEKRLRVIKPRIGGGFGGKQEIVLEDICAYLTLVSGKPVRMEYTREEEFTAARSRHPQILRFKTGVRRDGTITAMSLSQGEGRKGFPNPLRSSGLAECVAEGARRIAWERRNDPNWHVVPGRPHVRRGLGMAALIHGSGIPGIDMGGAYLKMNDDGSFNLMFGATDLGTGADGLAQDVSGVLQKLHAARDLLQLPTRPRRKTSQRGPAQLKGKRHSIERDRQAVTYHYDVSNDFYALWIDRRLVYSCAYFQTPDDDLDLAQERKLDYICRKLRLRPGQRLLDIGCGWGGLIIHAAQHYGVDATGITLSQPQAELASARIAAAGLTDRCRALVRDYREVNGPKGYDMRRLETRQTPHSQKESVNVTAEEYAETGESAVSRAKVRVIREDGFRTKGAVKQVGKDRSCRDHP